MTVVEQVPRHHRGADGACRVAVPRGDDGGRAEPGEPIGHGPAQGVEQDGTRLGEAAADDEGVATGDRRHPAERTGEDVDALVPDPDGGRVTGVHQLDRVARRGDTGPPGDRTGRCDLLDPCARWEPSVMRT